MTALEEFSLFIRNGASIQQTDGAGGDPITRIETIANRTVNLTKCGYADISSEDYEKYILQQGDILISHINSTKHLGKCAIYEADEVNVIHGMNLLCLRVDEKKAHPKYVFYMLSSSGFLRQLPKITKNSVNQSSFNVKSFQDLQIPLPPLETQKQIAAVLEKADQLRKDSQQMEQELNSLAQSVFIDMFGDPVTNPKGWEMGQLGKNAKLLAGFAFKSKEYSKNPEHVKLCRGINIFPGTMNWKNSEYWDYKNEHHLEKFELKENDIVIAMDRPWVSGGFKIATITKSDLPALLLQRVMRVRGKSKEQAKFLYHALRQPAFFNHCKMTETTVPHISPKDVSSYNIPVPSADELAKFYRLMHRIDENIELTKLDSNEAEIVFNSLMQKAFKGELNL